MQPGVVRIDRESLTGDVERRVEAQDVVQREGELLQRDGVSGMTGSELSDENVDVGFAGVFREGGYQFERIGQIARIERPGAREIRRRRR